MTMIEQEYRTDWPLRVRIKMGNPYGLPVGKEFPFARRKEGDGSPFAIEIKHMWPSVHSLRYYSLKDSEVDVLPLLRGTKEGE